MDLTKYIYSDRERILNNLNQELKKLNTFKSFSLIITCRENYIYKLQNIKCEYIVLQAWKETQIETFCSTYWGKCKKALLESKIQKIRENKEIFGIPLILYMILAFDIAIENSSSIVDVYDQVFSLENGVIYDRCYDSEHRINLPEVKEHICRISQKMAFWMFENNADKAFISQEKFKEICDNEMSEYGEKGKEIQSDVLIGNFFKLNHCEGKGTDELQFVHRSIYEYFVVLYFFESLNDLTSKEEIAGKFGELLKDGYLSEQILKFLKIKFDCMKQYNLFDIIKEVFQIMLRDGMIYHAKKPYTYAIEREMNIFSNMLKIVQLWNPILGKLDRRIAVYLQYNQSKLDLRGLEFGNIDLPMVYLSEANLNKANLNGANLRGAYLSSANLRGAHLFGVNLTEANLRGADLRGAYLNGANLRGANLKGANLEGAYLRGTYLREAYLNSADLRGINLIETNLVEADLKDAIFDEKQVDELCGKYNINGSKIYIFKTNELISYKKYCLSKQKK